MSHYKRTLELLLLGGAVSTFAFSIYAQSPTLFPTQKSQAPHLTHFTFIHALKPTAKKLIQFIPLGTNKDIPPGSHLRVLYTSHNPLPLEIGFRPQPETDFVTAILPPAEKGDVLLPLTVSPSWKWNLPTVIVNAYTLTDELPEEIGVQMIGLLGPWERFWVYLIQPWTSEVFGSSSINFLYGYRSAGVPVTLILGIAIIVISIVLSTLGRRAFLSIIFGTCFAMILLYQTRFMIDLVPEAFARTREWLTHGTYGEMTYTYQVAEVLKNEGDSLSVTICNDTATALHYLLYPTSVGSDKESWKSATHAVVTLYPWEEVQKEFTCHDTARPASVIKQFPTGDTVIRFTENPI